MTLPIQIHRDFEAVVDGLSPVILHYQPPAPAGSPEGTRLPPMAYLFCDRALKRERQIVADQGQPADVTVWHLSVNHMGGITPEGGESIIDNQGNVYVILNGSVETFSSRLRYVCIKPDAGTIKFKPWHTFEEFQSNLLSPERDLGEWTPPPGYQWP